MSLKELQQKIDEADVAYYTTGTSIIDDSVYDNMKEQLKKVNPTDIRLKRVGASLRDSIFEKREHKIPMNSLDKAVSETEFKAFITNTVGNLDEEFFASYKADGGSYSFEYEDGRLVYAVSRGDGKEGEDITANAIKFKDLPKFVTLTRIPFTGTVRGEVILDNDNWDIVDPDKTSNPRNLGVGIASRKDGHQCEHLRVLAFRIYDADNKLVGFTEEDQVSVLSKMGFKTIPSCKGKFKDIWNFYETTQTNRNSLDYWIDGIVVKVNNLNAQIQLGETSHHPKGQIALKFTAETATSKLLSVKLQVGQTGIICPVAEFEPVKLGGATVSNATLHNWDYINKLDIAVNDTITVIKAGDIIPKIIAAPIKAKDRIKIAEPDKCPICSSATHRKTNTGGDLTAAIFCLNDACSGKQIGKISKFISSLNILGIGDTIIESLVANKYISDVADLFSLKLFADSLPDLLMSGKTRLGEKRAEYILDEIDKKSSLELSEFLGALGIPGLGRRRVELIQSAMPGTFDKLDDWFSNKLVTNADAIGLPNLASNIQHYILNNKPLIEKCLKNGLTINSVTAPAVTSNQKNGPIYHMGTIVREICITGQLDEPRDYYEKLIKKKGIKWATSVKSSTSHLVVADKKAKKTTKVLAAEKKGVNIIDGQDLKDILNI